MKKLKIALVEEQDFYIGTKKEIEQTAEKQGWEDVVLLDIKQEEVVGFVIGITSCGTSLYDCNAINLTRDLDIAGIRKLVKKLAE